MKIDYYKIMGLSPSSSQEQIRNAFRDLAKKLHPDVNNSPNANEQFRILFESYEILKNPITRQQYDEIYLSNEIRVYDGDQGKFKQEFNSARSKSEHYEAMPYEKFIQDLKFEVEFLGKNKYSISGISFLSITGIFFIILAIVMGVQIPNGGAILIFMVLVGGFMIYVSIDDAKNIANNRRNEKNKTNSSK